jgi:sec-independent protein translocase protein TatA
MFGLGPSELVVVAVVAVLLFGSKLPEVARSLGRSYYDFKKGMTDIQDQFRKAENEFRRPLEQAKPKPSRLTVDDEFEKPTAPKFTPPT